MNEKKLKERTFFQTTKRYFAPTLVKENRLITLKSVLRYFLYWLIPVIHIFFIKHIVASIENNDKELFIQLIIYYALVNILYEILDFSVRKWWRVEDINSFRKVIHKEYLEIFIKLDNNEIENLWTGKITALIDNWMNVWSKSLNEFAYNFFGILVIFLFASYMILSSNLLYWFIFFITYIFIHIIWIFINTKTIKYRRQRENHRHNYVSKLVKIIMSKFEIMQSSKIDVEISKLDNINKNIIESNLKMVPYIHLFYRLPEWFVMWTQLFIIFYLWLEIFDWNINIATFVWIFWVLTLLSLSITNSMTFFKDFTKQFTSIEKMWDFFDETPEIKWYNSWKTFEYKIWEINIKNLNYWYTKTKPVFKNFSLNLTWWKITAFVWNSGSWKSTLVKLIAWYIRANSGEIKVDGQKLNETSLKSYYKNIGYLTQEPSVFDGTILDNLNYWVNEKIKKEKLEKIIKQAKCEFIYDLEKWLETEIWERWVRLSWWQKQRLAIAKIFLKDPKIIILDEPTSALDSFSEEQITKAMHNLFVWRTVIIIAHRLQTVKDADQIFLFENGEIKEKGTHKELVKLKWQYSKMLDLQSGF